jgi:hypothetical protein
MVQSAIVDTTRNKDFIEYFTGLIKGRERTRNQNEDVGQGGPDKMLVIAWTLLKKGGTFQDLIFQFTPPSPCSCSHE